MVVKYTSIKITVEQSKRIKKDRDRFKKDLNLSHFSIIDTINEYLKILNGLKNDK